MSFVLHERLIAATVPLGDLPLSRVLMLNDRTCPWLLLVPRRDAIEEINQLTTPDRHQLIDEIAQASDVLQRLYKPFRLNVGDLGNKAAQLHVHVVARSTEDAAWPNTVWSRPRDAYPADQLVARQTEMREGFSAISGFTPA